MGKEKRRKEIHTRTHVCICSLFLKLMMVVASRKGTSGWDKGEREDYFASLYLFVHYAFAVMGMLCFWVLGEICREFILKMQENSLIPPALSAVFRGRSESNNYLK